MRFHIKCIPYKTTAQASNMIMKTKEGRYFVGKSSNSKGAKAKSGLLQLFSPYTPVKPLLGAVDLYLRVVYPFRKNEPKKNKMKKMIPNDKRPDCSNIIKMIEDCMTRLGFWEDDGQIYSLTVEKYWGDDIGYHVAVNEYYEVTE